MPDDCLSFSGALCTYWQHWMDLVGLKRVHQVRRGKWSGCMGAVGAEGAWYGFDQNTSCMNFLKNKFSSGTNIKGNVNFQTGIFFFPLGIIVYSYTYSSPHFTRIIDATRMSLWNVWNSCLKALSIFSESLAWISWVSWVKTFGVYDKAALFPSPSSWITSTFLEGLWCLDGLVPLCSSLALPLRSFIYFNCFILCHCNGIYVQNSFLMKIGEKWPWFLF